MQFDTAIKRNLTPLYNFATIYHATFVAIYNAFPKKFIHEIRPTPKKIIFFTSRTCDKFHAKNLIQKLYHMFESFELPSIQL